MMRWPSVWPIGNGAHAGRDEVGGEGVEIGGQRRAERNVVRRGGDGDRDRVGDAGIGGSACGERSEALGSARRR